MFDRNTNWGRLTPEVVAIVSSILLAFAIDAWWQELQEQRFEDEVIQALTDEYETNRRVLSFIRNMNLKMRRATASLISASHRGVYASDEFSIDEALHWARIPPTTDLGNSVRDTLMSSGQLELISDEQLRFQLAGWQSVFDELKDDEELNKKVALEVLIPYMTRNGIPFRSPDRAAARQDAPLPGVVDRSLETDQAAREQLFSDPEFLSIMELRYASLFHTTGEFDRVISEVDEILVALNRQ